MVEISLSGSGEGPGWVTAPGYSTAAFSARPISRSSVNDSPAEGASPRLGIARRSRSMTLFVPAEGRPFVDPATGKISLRRILLPVDLKPDAGEAVVRATRVATILGDSEVESEFLHVGEGSVPPVAKPEGEQWRFRESVLSGPVVETILSRAQEADLIVMPTDGRDGVLDAFRGSFTERVVPEAPCPMLAVSAS